MVFPLPEVEGQGEPTVGSARTVVFPRDSSRRQPNARTPVMSELRRRREGGEVWSKPGLTPEAITPNNCRGENNPLAARMFGSGGRARPEPGRGRGAVQ